MFFCIGYNYAGTGIYYNMDGFMVPFKEVYENYIPANSTYQPDAVTAQVFIGNGVWADNHTTINGWFFCL